MARFPEPMQKVISDYVADLSKYIPVQKVILFGSYAKDQAHEYSDVDIAVFSDYFQHMSRVENIHFLLLRAMDYDIDLEPQPFTMDEYKKPIGLVKEILNTGIEIPIPMN